MTTFATPNTARRVAELDARTRVAWTTYRDALQDLEGAAYHAAEAAEWDQLQSTLRELDGARAALAGPPAGD